jgi:cell wall-associated NlpC family hydrolase
VVAIALAQVGKQYVWGAIGPERFDCSGLMQWSYAQIGIRIPRSTATQWPGLRAISLSQMQPGDMVFFDTRAGIRTPNQITHVGMVADVNGDGQWDLIHAASPHAGVRVDYAFLTSSYYGPRLFGEARTVR